MYWNATARRFIVRCIRTSTTPFWTCGGGEKPAGCGDGRQPPPGCRAARRCPYLHPDFRRCRRPPTWATTRYRCRKALLRRLVEAGTRVVQYGYAGRRRGCGRGGPIARRPKSTTSRSAAVGSTLWRLRTQAATDDGRDRCHRFQWRSRKVATGHLNSTRSPTACIRGQMVVVAARLAWKHPLGWTSCGHASIRHRYSVIFSLEMEQVRDCHATAVGGGQNQSLICVRAG